VSVRTTGSKWCLMTDWLTFQWNQQFLSMHYEPEIRNEDKINRKYYTTHLSLLVRIQSIFLHDAYTCCLLYLNQVVRPES